MGPAWDHGSLSDLRPLWPEALPVWDPVAWWAGLRRYLREVWARHIGENSGLFDSTLILTTRRWVVASLSSLVRRADDLVLASVDRGLDLLSAADHLAGRIVCDGISNVVGGLWSPQSSAGSGAGRGSSPRGFGSGSARAAAARNSAHGNKTECDPRSAPEFGRRSVLLGVCAGFVCGYLCHRVVEPRLRRLAARVALRCRVAARETRLRFRARRRACRDALSRLFSFRRGRPGKQGGKDNTVSIIQERDNKGDQRKSLTRKPFALRTTTTTTTTTTGKNADARKTSTSARHRVASSVSRPPSLKRASSITERVDVTVADDDAAGNSTHSASGEEEEEASETNAVDAETLRRKLDDGDLVTLAFDGESYRLRARETLAPRAHYAEDRRRLLKKKGSGRHVSDGRVVDDCVAALSKFSVADPDPEPFRRAARDYVAIEQRARYGVALRALSREPRACVALLRLVRKPSEPSEPPRAGDVAVVFVPTERDPTRSIEDRTATTPIVVNQLLDALTSKRVLAPYTIRVEADAARDDPDHPLHYDAVYRKLFQVGVVS